MARKGSHQRPHRRRKPKGKGKYKAGRGRVFRAGVFEGDPYVAVTKDNTIKYSRFHQIPFKKVTKKRGQGKSTKTYFGTIEQQRIRRIFKKYQDKRHWKNPASAFVLTQKEAEDVALAYGWFHGKRGIIKKSSGYVSHRDGLVRFPVTGYSVKTEGYCC